MTSPYVSANGWLRCRRRPFGARVRLVCLPHAGGSASGYLRWARQLPDDVEVYAAQYPGREDRFNETPCASMPELVDPLIDALSRREDATPLVLFGHSLGGAICYEIAAGLQARGYPPDLAIISARQPPSLHRPGMLHNSDDQALLADLRRLNPGNTAAFDSPDLMSLALPMIRADYQVIETYVPQPKPLLNCPLLIMLGESDPELTVVDAEAWSGYTSADIRIQTFAGDHFYLESNRNAVLSYLVHVLSPFPSYPKEPRDDKAQS